MRNLLKLALALFAATALVHNLKAETKVEAVAVQANNHIGFDLAQKVTAQEKSKNGKAAKNILVSPVSLFYVAAMAENGSGGATQEAFNKYFGLAKSFSQDEFNQSSAAFLKELFKAPLSKEELEKLPPWRRPHVLTIANSAWRSAGKTESGKLYAFSEKFKKILEKQYSAEVSEKYDFKKQDATDAINAWVSKKTNKLIPTIMDTSTLNEMVWVLLNATYLEGSWDQAFTVPEQKLSFNRLDGTKKDTTQIMRSAEGAYYQDADVQAVELTLSGGALSAYVVLPKKANQFLDLANQVWTQERWQKIQNGKETARINLSMPKFSFASGVELKKNEDLTQALGLNFAFQNSTDFSPMATPSSPPTEVGLIKQNAKLEWDEKGIKAAAATLVGGIERTSLPKPPIAVTVDHPFYIAIAENKTGAFLFLGQVTDPTVK